jgi:hypothetical protein
MASSLTMTSMEPSITASQAFQTVFITVTTTASSSGTPVPPLSPDEQKKVAHGQIIAQWTAIAVFGVYVLLAICMFSCWIARRLKRQPPPPALFDLPPETTQHGQGESLMPISGNQLRGKRKQNGRRNMSGSSSSSVTTAARSTRSMFYEGPGSSTRSSTLLNVPTSSDSSRPVSKHRRYSSSVTNLVPLQNPPIASPYAELAPHGGETPGWEEEMEIAASRTRRSRSSSHSTLRYYYTEHHDEVEPVPMVPPRARQEPRSSEFYSVDLERR